MKPSCSLFLVLVLTACAPRLLPPPKIHVYRDDRPIPGPPKARDPSLASEIIEMSFAHQLGQVLDAPRAVRKLLGRPYQALDVDAFDEVPNSSWFTNRSGRTVLSLEEVRRGPNRSSGPDTTGPWTVVALKSAGVTPGMTVVDSRGDRYILKFDPPAFPELPSGTEVVATRLLYAAGYNVPENYIVYLAPDRLVSAPGAGLTVATSDKRGPIRKRSMTRRDLDHLLGKVNPDGRKQIRVLASRFLSGVPVGPWGYTGVRKDDPNDAYPHEHRREVRGFYVVASWINHADMKEENTLDMYDPERRVLTHYLIDFGASMGSNSTNPSNPRRGQANSFDLKDSFTRLVTLGLWVHDYERAPKIIRYPSVGYLENDLFKPGRWKPMYPVPAFENMTKRDAFWGARIVTAFTDAQIEAAVAAGRFSDPDAAAYLAGFLRERRDRIGRYWFTRLNTLDQFTLTDASTLSFVDLAVSRGYAAAGQTRYRYQVLSPPGRVLDQGHLSLPSLSLQPAWQGHEYVAVSLLPRRPAYQAKPVLVYLRPTGDGWELLGLRRLD